LALDANEIIAGAAVAAILAPGCVWGGKRAWSFSRKIGAFLTDWDGTPGRPGVPGTPGVMQRLSQQDDQLTAIQAEVIPNGGGSIKDAVHRIDICIISLDERVSRIEAVPPCRPRPGPGSQP